MKIYTLYDAKGFILTAFGTLSFLVPAFTIFQPIEQADSRSKTSAMKENSTVTVKMITEQFHKILITSSFKLDLIRHKIVRLIMKQFI